MTNDLREQGVERLEALVDDVTLGLVLRRGADELVVGVVVRGRRRGAKHHVGVGVGREDHVQQLRQVLLVGDGVVVGLEDVEQATGLEALAKLLDGLGADAVDV